MLSNTVVIGIRSTPYGKLLCMFKPGVGKSGKRSTLPASCVRVIALLVIVDLSEFGEPGSRLLTVYHPSWSECVGVPP